MENVKQLGAGGASVAYLMDGQVIRKPNINTDIDEWLKSAEKECLITEKLQQTGCIVPQSVLKNGTLVSLFFAGKPLDEQTYVNLEPKKQAELASDFAGFLYQLHHLQASTSTDDSYASDKLSKKLERVQLPQDLNEVFRNAISTVK